LFAILPLLAHYRRRVRPTRHGGEEGGANLANANPSVLADNDPHSKQVAKVASLLNTFNALPSIGYRYELLLVSFGDRITLSPL